MQRVADYVIDRMIGRGGMGAVFLARHQPTGVMRALKVLAGPVDDALLERFRREAETLARAGGEGVVPVHEVGVVEGRPYFVMSVMPNGSLRTRLDDQGRLPWRKAVALAIEIARAIERCHSVNVLHRDLKPDNVLFDEHDRPRIADFGVARDLDASSLTDEGTVLGTPAYMPPEQLAGQPVDARADVYALAAMLHELVSGSLPFDGATVYELLNQKEHGLRRSLPGDMPPALEATIARALAGNPEKRHDSMRELALDLARLLADAEPAPASRREALAVLVAALAAILLVGAVLVLSADRASAPAPAATPEPVLALTATAPPADDLDAARRSLHEAAVLLASGGSLPKAAEHVKRAQRACPSRAVPLEGLAAIIAASLQRIETTSESGSILSSFEVLDRRWRDIEGTWELLFAVGAPRIMTAKSAGLGLDYAVALHDQPNPDWERLLAISMQGLEFFPDRIEELSIWIVTSFERGANPRNGLSTMDRAATIAPPGIRERVLRRRAAIFRLLERWDDMLDAANAALVPGLTREQVAKVAREVSCAPVPPGSLETAKLDALVAKGGATPELLLMRACHSGPHRGDVTPALAADLPDSWDAARAAELNRSPRGP